MAIIKNDIPILEYDDSQISVIMPDHEKLDFQLPEKVVFAFLGECIDDYAEKHGGKTVAEFISITKKYPIYVIEYEGEEIAGIQMYWDVNATLNPGEYTVELFADNYRLASKKFTMKK